MTSVGDCTLLAPGGGVWIDRRLRCLTINVGAASSRQVGVVEGEVPPGGGFQVPHWREDVDEVFYVLEGEVEFLLDGQGRRAVPSSTGFVPVCTVHAFRNASGRPGRQLGVGARGGRRVPARAAGGGSRTPPLALRRPTRVGADGWGVSACQRGGHTREH